MHDRFRFHQRRHIIATANRRHCLMLRAQPLAAPVVEFNALTGLILATADVERLQDAINGHAITPAIRATIRRASDM